MSVASFCFGTTSAGILSRIRTKYETRTTMDKSTSKPPRQLVRRSLRERVMLCKHCWNMTATSEGLERLFSWGGYYGQSKSETEKFALRGCEMCDAVISGIHGDYLNWLKSYERRTWVSDSSSQAITYAFFAGTEDSLRTGTNLVDCLSRIRVFAVHLEDMIARGDGDGQLLMGSLPAFRREFGGYRASDKEIAFHVFTTADDLAANLVPQLAPESSNRSPDTFTSAIECLNRCFKEHDNCPPAELPHLPTRLLHIEELSSSSSSSPERIRANLALRLHVSSADEKAQYAALSYCWGGDQELITTRESLESHIKSLNLSSLPATIQDAVEVTHNLNIKYLWVDSLSIVQDDELDKDHEIERMGEIYKNATMTIAAARSASSKHGFLTSYRPPRSIFSKVAVDGQLGKIWLVPQVIQDLSEEPLAKRGWAFQEQILSPRLLHFGSRGVTWHCSTERSRHVVPHFVQYTVSGARLPRQIEELVRMPATKSLSTSSLTDSAITHFWPEIIEDYSSRQLTLSADKLLAIAGVASEVHKLCPDVYLAGLWRLDIVRQLAWKRKEMATLIRWSAISDCDVPAWSWASTLYPIELGKIFEADAHFISSDVRPRNSKSPFGNVVGKRLILNARIIEVEGNVALQKSPVRVVFDMGPTYGPATLWEIEHKKYRAPKWYVLLGYTSIKAPIGLVLRQIEGKTFQRIGYFEALDLNYPDFVLNDYLKALERTEIEIS